MYVSERPQREHIRHGIVLPSGPEIAVSTMSCPPPAGHRTATIFRYSEWIIVVVVASVPRGSSRWAPFSHDRPRTSYGREPFVGQDSDHKERRGPRWPLLETRPFLAKNSVANDRDGGSRSWLRLLMLR